MTDLELAGRLLRHLATTTSSEPAEYNDHAHESDHDKLGDDVVGLFDALLATDFDLFRAIANWAHDA
ncbi:hypothetical protein [Mycobacteroides abscessus]|uniref:hypothetical protein n=1 Tax=Mycobacteroides abscessus TaxID=36809 RepID=UPI0006979026|nr:hypothetical protein [Mycobacteroides abscessus]MBN7385368.1 hypothetical protein [Mycobacteroides abscessus subsp. abscessus]MBN7416958.1 hypothetical protein [Mycobacteroides abscessus subsp. abscessus]MBN7486233.1 hypothetical protein [Mycobacteroides abscessus subsp. abscessus]MBN7501263.1 hypothetical protein [Mycobacteroides abscessus subsp. abscessus]MDB2190901.1 hypothetical protein [Mycobacteroides abscessus subsp. abscessus]